LSATLFRPNDIADGPATRFGAAINDACAGDRPTGDGCPISQPQAATPSSNTPDVTARRWHVTEPASSVAPLHKGHHSKAIDKVKDVAEIPTDIFSPCPAWGRRLCQNGGNRCRGRNQLAAGSPVLIIAFRSASTNGTERPRGAGIPQPHPIVLPRIAPAIFRADINLSFAPRGGELRAEMM